MPVDGLRAVWSEPDSQTRRQQAGTHPVPSTAKPVPRKCPCLFLESPAQAPPSPGSVSQPPRLTCLPTACVEPHPRASGPRTDGARAHLPARAHAALCGMRAVSGAWGRVAGR